MQITIRQEAVIENINKRDRNGFHALLRVSSDGFKDIFVALDASDGEMTMSSTETIYGRNFSYLINLRTKDTGFRNETFCATDSSDGGSVSSMMDNLEEIGLLASDPFSAWMMSTDADKSSFGDAPDCLFSYAGMKEWNGETITVEDNDEEAWKQFFSEPRDNEFLMSNESDKGITSQFERLLLSDRIAAECVSLANRGSKNATQNRRGI